MYQAIYNSNTIVQSSVGKVVVSSRWSWTCTDLKINCLLCLQTAFDPPTPSGTPAWEYVFDVSRLKCCQPFASGLLLITTQALTFGLSLYSEGSVLTKALLRSLPQSSSLLTKVFPEGQVEGTVTEWADVAGMRGLGIHLYHTY